MRKSLPVALALAWVAFADPSLAGGTGVAGGTGPPGRTALTADLPFKVLSAGKAAGQLRLERLDVAAVPRVS